MTVRSLAPDERAACLDLWATAFDDTPRDYFLRYFDPLADPSVTDDDTQVCVVDGRIVSAVHVVRREAATHEGRTVRFAGIANVATHPDYRKRGYNTACLRATLDRIEADPSLDFALLGTDIHDYYARLGWRRWVLGAIAGLPAPLPAPAPGLRIDDATEEDVPLLAALHERWRHGRTLAVRRHAGYWRGWMHWRAESTRIARDADGVAVGYLIGRIDGGTLSVEEAVVPEGEESPALAALLADATRHAESRGAARLYWALPPTPTLQRLAAALLVDATPETDADWMVRPLRGRPLPASIDAPGALYLPADGF